MRDPGVHCVCLIPYFRKDEFFGFEKHLPWSASEITLTFENRHVDGRDAAQGLLPNPSTICEKSRKAGYSVILQSKAPSDGLEK
jgi:hypothetical protein